MECWRASRLRDNWSWLVLAEQVALLSWRLHRVTRYERETMVLSQEKVEEDLATRRRIAGDSIYEAWHPEEVRMDHEDAKKTQRLLERLPTLPGEKRLSSEEAGSVLLAVWSQVDEEVGLEEVEIPGIPEALDPDLLFEYASPGPSPW